MKNGFTLIELLAVIVILAIIALIAIPIVLSIINDTKESAVLRSAEFYVDAVKNKIMQENMKSGGTLNPNECNIDSNGNAICDGTLLEIEVDGEKPTEGSITFNKGNAENVYLKYNGYEVIKENNKFLLNNNNNKVQWKKLKSVVLPSVNENFGYIGTKENALLYYFDVYSDFHSLYYYDFNLETLKEVMVDEEFGTTVYTYAYVDGIYLFKGSDGLNYYSKNINGPYYYTGVSFEAATELYKTYYLYNFDNGYVLVEYSDDIARIDGVYYFEEIGNSFAEIELPTSTDSNYVYYDNIAFEDGFLIYESQHPFEDMSIYKYYKDSIDGEWKKYSGDFPKVSDDKCKYNKLGSYYYNSSTHSYSESCDGPWTEMGKITYNGANFEYSIVDNKFVAYYKKDDDQLLVFYTTRLDNVESYDYTE